MRLFLLFVGSWLLGVMLFWLAGSIISGKVMGSGDIGAVWLYSGMIFWPTAPVMYLPAIWWVRRRARDRQAAIVMSAVAGAHTVLASAILLAQFGGFRMEMLMTTEALGFYMLYGAAGAIIGLATMKSSE